MVFLSTKFPQEPVTSVPASRHSAMVAGGPSIVGRHRYFVCLSSLLLMGVTCFFCTSIAPLQSNRIKRRMTLQTISHRASTTWVEYPCGYARNPAMATSHEMPRRIWQTYRSREVPEEAKKNMEQWATSNPGWDVYFCDDGELRRLFEILGQPYLKAYDDMPLGIMRSDFWRYAILHRYGGLYTDMDVKERLPLNSWVAQWKAPMAVVGLENDVHFCQWALLSTSGHPLLKTVLDLIVAQVQRGIVLDEDMVHNTTGPGIWTQAIKEYLGPAAKLLSPSEILARPDLWMPKHTTILSQGAFRDGLVLHSYGSQIWAKDSHYVSWLDDRMSYRKNVASEFGYI